MTARYLFLLMAVATIFFTVSSISADGDDSEESSFDIPPTRPLNSKMGVVLNQQIVESFSNWTDPINSYAMAEEEQDEPILVRIVTDPESNIISTILSGWGYPLKFSSPELIYAEISLGDLGILAEHESVYRIDTVSEQPIHTVVSEGAGTHNAPPWNLKGYTGSGVKIGIIDGGFAGYSSLMGSELPSTVEALCFVGPYETTDNLSDCETYSDSSHGTAVAEAIFDIAPDAEFYIASVTGAQIDMTHATEWLVSKGVKIINMSLGPVESYGPGDGTTQFTDSPLYAIDTAVNGGALWVNAAGNYAEQVWRGNGILDSDGDGWVETGYLNSLFVNTLENNCVSMNAGVTLTASLRWEDSWPGATADLGLYLYYTLGGSEYIMAGSDAYQIGDGASYPLEPIESFVAPYTGSYCFKIFNWTPLVTPSWLELQTRGNFSLNWYGEDISQNRAYTLASPSESSNPGMLSVGAADWQTSSTLESFSSRGPTVDGRLRPDIVGVDNGNSATSGAWQGTSQSSPHIAGLAALVAQKFPGYSPVQLADYLRNNALPRGDSSPNYEWGYGLGYLPSLVPDPVSSVIATTTAGIADISVSWDKPSVDGGEDINKFTVLGQPDNLTTFTIPFGSGGKITTDIDSGEDYLLSSVLDSSGNLIAVGASHNGSNYDFVVVKYTKYGELDTGFGTDGVVLTEVGSDYDAATDLVLDDEGNIVVSGYSHNGTDFDFAIVRYDADGNLDSSFSSDGKETIDFYENTDVANGIALDSQGNIVVGGYVYVGSDQQVGIIRLKPSGILDTAFSDDGVITFGSSNYPESISDVQIDSNDRVVFVGSVHSDGLDEDALIGRLTNDGVFDTSFSTDGISFIDHGQDDNYAYSVNILSNDDLIIAGGASNGSDSDFSLFKLDADGTISTDFIASLTDFSSSIDIAFDSYIDENEKIILVGQSVDTSTDEGDFAVARFSPDGSPDLTFGNSGIALVDFASDDDTSFSVTETAEGNIILVGQTKSGSSYDFAAARTDSLGNLNSGLSATFSELNPGTSYSFTVYAESSVGTSDSSPVSNSVTPIVVPGSPLNVLVSVGNEQAEITWSEPNSNGGSPVLSYNITTNIGGISATTTEMSHVLTGLTNGVEYTVTVAATTIAGTGPSSVASEIFIPAAVPDSPDNITAVADDEKVSLTWDASSDNGSPITLYTIVATPGGSVVTSTSTSVIFEGLNNGTPYTFVVAATNSAGDSIYSDPSNIATPVGVPGIPTNVVAASNASQTATIQWNPPVNDGGGVDSYTVTASPGGTSVSTAGNTAEFTGLINGREYTFLVFATNSAGSGPSELSPSITPLALPGAPTNLIGLPGNNEIHLSWDSPDDGGSTITLYTVIDNLGNTYTTTEPEIVISSLQNGVQYSFNVSATNAAGTGPVSVSIENLIPRTVPGKPRNVLASLSEPRKANISWDSPLDNGGFPIQHYTVTSIPSLILATTTATVLDVEDLTYGTEYRFEVSATNISGMGLNSSTSNGVIPINRPESPTNVIAVGGDEEATVTWDVPASNGAAIISYKLSAVPAILPIVSSSNSVTVQSLQNGTTYKFSIKATNSVGDSDSSALSNPVIPAPSELSVEFIDQIGATEGQSVVYTIARVINTGPSYSATVSIDWGDGTVSTKEISASTYHSDIEADHLYVENGTFQVTVTAVTTADSASASGSIVIFNADPVVELEEFQAATSSGYMAPKATYFDAGIQDSHTAIIDWGDGQSSVAQIDVSNQAVGGNHIYVSEGTYQITVTVEDDDGGRGTVSRTIEIENPNTIVAIPSIGFWGLIILAVLLMFAILRKSWKTSVL